MSELKKLLILSHSYIEPENQKNLDALRGHFDVRALVPRRGGVLVFKEIDCVVLPSLRGCVIPSPTLRFSRGQYLYLSLSLFSEIKKADALVIEYNPWSLVFVQAWAVKYLVNRKAMIICMIKKNTYREYAGVLGMVKTEFSQYLVKSVQLFLAASEMAARMLKNKFAIADPRIDVVHHLGVDMNSFYPRKYLHDEPSMRNSPINVGYCGRFEDVKGVLELFKAIEEIRQSGLQDVRLTMLGDGSLRHELERLASSREWFSVKGPCPNAEVAEYLRTLDLFVIFSKAYPDHEEHDAHALLEALSCGIVCVGSDVGIIPEILTSEVGVVVERENGRQLLMALRTLIVDSAARKKVSEAARRWAETHCAIAAVARKKAIAINHILKSQD